MTSDIDASIWKKWAPKRFVSNRPVRFPLPRPTLDTWIINALLKLSDIDVGNSRFSGRHVRQFPKSKT